MSTFLEIASAADALPRSQQELLLRHLSAKLQRAPDSCEKSAIGTASDPLAWPDYEARLRAIYGDETMPSMVLAERDSAAW